MVLRGRCPRQTPVAVHLLGGTLTITVCEDDAVKMTGPAVEAFTGEVEVQE